MADELDTGAGINVGDAVLTWIGDTTNLEEAWTQMEENSKASATRTLNAVLKAYDTIGTEGTNKLRKAAQDAQQAFQTIRDSGVASLGDVTQAELAMLEAQAEVKKSMGEMIPVEVVGRIESLRLQYIGLTGTVDEFYRAQTKSAATMVEVEQNADRNSIALKREAEAVAAEVAEYERLWAVQNAASANNARSKKSGSGAGGAANAAASGAEEEEEGALAGATGAVLSTAKSLALYAGIAAVAGSLAEGVKQSLAFDAAFAELTTVIQTGGKEDAQTIAAIKQELLDLPPVLGDVTTLTKGVYQAISAGIPAGEAVRFVADAAIYARGALTDQETAVKLVSASLNAYGLTAQDAAHVTSALFETIRVGVLRGPELAESLGRVLPVAANLKVSFAEVLAAASTLTKGGLSADESMTALRQVLNSIEKPSSEATKAMRATGLSFQQVREEIREKGLATALADLGKHIQGNTQLTTELFPNIRALTGVLSLTGAQANFYSQAVQNINKAYTDGTEAQKAFATVTGSLDGQLKSLGNTISNDFVKGFQTAQPIVEAFGPSLKSLLVDTGVLKVGIVALLAVLLTAAVTLNTAAIAVEGLKNAFATLGYYSAKLASDLPNTAEGAKKVADRMNFWKGAMDNSTTSINQNREAMKNSLKAFDDVMRGTDGAAEANRNYAKAMADQATQQDKATAAAKAASDAAEAVKQKQAEEAERVKELEEAYKKAVKAMEAYANAHNIPLSEELLKNVTAARQFAQEMEHTHQSTATVNAAVINLNMQLSKLRSMLADTRSVGQTLFDIGRGSQTASPKTMLDEMVPTESEMETRMKGLAYAIQIGAQNPEAEAMRFGKEMGQYIMNPVKDAFDVLVKAEQELGIKGTATLQANINKAAAAVEVVSKAFKEGRATAQELAAAQDVLNDANQALDDSFSSAAKHVAELELAEKTLGITGVAQARARAKAFSDAAKEVKYDYQEQRAGAIEYQEAQLASDKATRDLFLLLGKPVPKQLQESIDHLTNSLKKYQAASKSAKTEDQQWYQFWHQAAPNMSQQMSNLADMGTQAFQDLSSGFGSAVKEFESGQKSLGEAVKDAVQQTLESLSGQAAAYALYYAGLGLAALATGDEAGAGEFFAAAAEMGVVAAVAGAAGMAMGSDSSSSGGGASGSGASTTGATATVTQPIDVRNVTRYGSGALVSKPTLAMIGDSAQSASQGADEAVLPLEDPKAMARVGSAISDASGGMGGDMYVNIEGLISPDNLDKVMDQMSTRVGKGKKLVASHANKVTKKSGS